MRLLKVLRLDFQYLEAGFYASVLCAVARVCMQNSNDRSDKLCNYMQACRKGSCIKDHLKMDSNV